MEDAMNTQTDSKPAPVPTVRNGGKANQAGEVRARWAWTDPCVWTTRMLAALEKGVKGERWFSLIDKVYSPGALRNAFMKVKSNAGAAGGDQQTNREVRRGLAANPGKI